MAFLFALVLILPARSWGWTDDCAGSIPRRPAARQETSAAVDLRVYDRWQVDESPRSSDSLVLEILGGFAEENQGDRDAER